MKLIILLQRNSVFAIVLIAVCLSVMNLKVNGQSVTIGRGSVGIIFDSSGKQALGTGFVAIDKKQVITCSHVVSIGSQWIYQPVGKEDGRVYKLQMKRLLPQYDLAVLSAEEEICDKPLLLGSFQELQPGDQVFYLGLKVEIGTVEANIAAVYAKGKAKEGEKIVEFVEFVGVGKPGFSGGPVFTTKGKVIAVMREAWLKRGLMGREEILMNRAFSSDPLNTTMSKPTQKVRNEK